MTLKITLTKPFQKDLKDIQKYIEKDNFKSAQKIIGYIINKIETIIVENPNIGRYGNNLRTREFILTKYPYKIVYTVNGNELVILRVLHTSRKW